MSSKYSLLGVVEDDHYNPLPLFQKYLSYRTSKMSHKKYSGPKAGYYYCQSLNYNQFL